jgi:hypothetical protein
VGVGVGVGPGVGVGVGVEDGPDEPTGIAYILRSPYCRMVAKITKPHYKLASSPKLERCPLVPRMTSCPFFDVTIDPICGPIMIPFLYPTPPDWLERKSQATSATPALDIQRRREDQPLPNYRHEAWRSPVPGPTAIAAGVAGAPQHLLVRANRLTSGHRSARCIYASCCVCIMLRAVVATTASPPPAVLNVNAARSPPALGSSRAGGRGPAPYSRPGRLRRPPAEG